MQASSVFSTKYDTTSYYFSVSSEHVAVAGRPDVDGSAGARANPVGGCAGGFLVPGRVVGLPRRQ